MQLVKSTTIHRGRVFTLRQDQLRLQDGQIIELDILDHPAAVTMVPVDPDGQVWFIRQYRHSAGGELLELPAGASEPDEAPEVSAQREIREEIGMAAGKLLRLGGFYLAAGYSTEYMHIYLATELYPAPLPGDIDELITIEKKSAREALVLAETGEIEDAKTLVALFWARSHLAQFIPTSGAA